MVDIVVISSVHSNTDIRVVSKELGSLINAYGPRVKYFCFEKKIGQEAGEEALFLENIEVKRDNIKNRFIRMVVRPVRLAVNVFREKPHIVHFHDPELLVFGLILSFFSVHVIYDAHENISKQILSKPYLNKYFRNILSGVIGAFEQLCVKRMHVVAATSDIAARTRHRSLSTTIVRNRPLSFELDFVDSFGNVQKSDNGKFEIFYAGSISEIRGILTLIDALELLDSGFQLNLLGRFNSQELYSRCRARKGWEKVNYYGQVSRVEMYRIASTSDIAVTLFHPEPNHLEALPNKIFEYFAARKPVLISDFPFWRSEFLPTRECISQIRNHQRILRAI